MRRVFRAMLWLGCVFFVMLTALSLWGADMAYTEAGRWFAAGTYQVECAPGQVNAGHPGCQSLLAEEPSWPAGVPVTDPDVLLALGSTVHDTATAVLTVGGLFLSVAGLFLGLATFLGANRKEKKGEAGR